MQSRFDVQKSKGKGASGKDATPAPAPHVQLKKAISGQEGFDAQSAALAPPSEWAPVQHKGGQAAGDVHAAAAHGIASGGGALPHLDAIQQSFGKHDVSSVQAHTGQAAQQANQAMGAEAYATGDHVAFGGAPDMHTVAHEAAHVVQQRAGVSLEGGVGQSGDAYEQHADKVADAVVKGESAEGLLDQMAGGGAGGGATQKKAIQRKTVSGGPELVAVQEKLNKAGYDCGTPDGIWGPKTSAAVKKFQGDKGLTPDGIIGPQTLAALDNAAGAPGGSSGTPPKTEDKKESAPAGKAADDKGAAAAPKGGGGSKDKSPAPPAGDKGASAAPPAADKKDEGAAPPAEEKKEAPPPVSGGRQAAAAAAYAEVGKVKAKDSSGKDAEGNPARVGWERLVEYFNVSFGGGWKDQDLLIHKRGGTKMEHGTGKQVATEDTLPSWCGIFAVYCVKQGGFSVGNWGLGKAAPNIMKKQAKVPQVGDIVVTSSHNHHALVVWVAPDAAEKAAAGKYNSIEIKTVDGNSGSNPVSGGEVVDKGSSTMAKWNWGAWSPE